MFDQSSRTPTPNSPLAVYNSKMANELVADPSQQQAIMALDKLHRKLSQQDSNEMEPVKGLYLWGDVGRGKTFLMDLFYDCLPQEGKLKLHFHRFMARIHEALEVRAGQTDPLKLIAKDLAKQSRVLCFDEFFVSDIGDAMIIAGLFECLFKQGVVLVATSNIPIERLYENGLARYKFLPTIALLENHTQSLHLAGEKDHRLHQFQAEQSETPVVAVSKYIGTSKNMDFEAIFSDLIQATNAKKINNSSINVCHRDIKVVRATERGVPNSIVWFDFYDLCESPRSQLDYMEIANHFNTVMLSGVPQMGGQIRGWIKARGTEDGIGGNQASATGERTLSYAVNDDMARRFISLLDELYDQKITLYLSSEVPLEELYVEGALMFEFRRAYSRLIEMSRG